MRNAIQPGLPGKWPQKRDKHKPQSLFVPGSVCSVGLRQNKRERWTVFMASVYATPGLRLDGRLQSPELSIHHFLMASDLLLKIHAVGFEEIIVATLLKVAFDIFFLMDSLMLGYFIFCDSTFWGRKKECKPEWFAIYFFFFSKTKLHSLVAVSVQLFLRLLREGEFCLSYAWLKNVLSDVLNQPFLKLKNNQCWSISWIIIHAICIKVWKSQCISTRVPPGTLHGTDGCNEHCRSSEPLLANYA